jgi:Na+/melibiose symporter-like transporter
MQTTQAPPAIPSDRFPLPRLVLFSMGLFAVQTFWGFLSATLPLFLIGITPSKALVGLILSASGVFGVVMPIVAGTMSDRARWRLGRRKPFIVGGWAVVVVALTILPRATSPAVAVPLTLALFAAFFFTMGPYFAFLADITTPAHRGRAAGVMFLVGGTGVVIFLLFGAPLWDADHALPFYWTAVTVIVSIAILMAGVREAPTAAAPEPGPGAVRTILNDRRIMTFYAAMILWWSGIWMVNFFFVIAVKELLGASNRQAFFALVLTTAGYVVLAFPVGLLGDRFGHRRVLMGGLLSLSLILLGVPLISGMKGAYVLMLGAGAGYSVALSVAYAFFLRLIPEGQTARLFGFYMACQNGSLIIGNALGGAALQYLGPPFLFVGAGLLVLFSLAVVSRIRR